MPRLPGRTIELRARALLAGALRRGYDAATINAILGELEAEGRALLAEAAIAGAQVTVERSADMRLTGQMHEINVPLPAGAIEQGSLGAIRTAFAERLHQALHVALRRGRDRGDQLPRARAWTDARTVLDQAGAAAALKRKGSRQVWFGDGFAKPPCMTATRSRPATGSKARRSSRSARRPPSCRPAIALHGRR